MKLDYTFQQRCEKIAVDQRRLLYLEPYDAMSGEMLADFHAVKVMEPSQLPGVTEENIASIVNHQNWDGILLPSLPNYFKVVLLHPRLPSTRRQSTIMHELAHLLLGHEPMQWSTELSEFTARRQQDEDEAAHLGGCLQIPRVGLVWASQIGLSIARTASHFGASEQMVIYRANITCIRMRR